MELAMMAKRSEEMELIRLVRADIITFAGMGAKKAPSLKQVMSLPIIDNADIILPIRTLDEAVKFLKEFE